MEKELYYDKLPEEYSKYPITKYDGTSSACFIINDGKDVFKRLENMDDIAYELKGYTDIESDCFVFPKSLVYEEGKLVGCIKDFVPGVTLRDSDLNIDFDVFINALQELEMCIAKDVTKNYVQITDMNGSNLIFTPDNKIKVVDTELFISYYDENLSQLMNINMREYNNDLLSCLHIENIKNEYFEGLFRKVLYGMIFISEYLTEVMNYLRANSNKPLVTVKDFCEALNSSRKI